MLALGLAMTGPGAFSIEGRRRSRPRETKEREVKLYENSGLRCRVTIGADQPGNQDSKIEDPEKGFDYGEAASLARNRRDTGSAERGHGGEAVVDKIETVGTHVEVGQRIQVESAGLQQVDHSIDAGKGKTHQQIDAEGTEDGFQIGLAGSDDSTEDHGDDQCVKQKAKNDVEHRKRAVAGREVQAAVKKSRNGQNDGLKTCGVDAKEDRGAANDAEGVVPERTAFGERIEQQGCQQEQEKDEKLVAG